MAQASIQFQPLPPSTGVSFAGQKRPRQEDVVWDASFEAVTGPDGGVAPAADAATVVQLLASAQAVEQRSRMVQALQMTGDAAVLSALVREGIHKSVRDQIRSCAAASDVEGVRSLLMLLLQLPVDLAAIKSSAVGAVVLRLAGKQRAAPAADRATDRNAVLDAINDEQCRSLASDIHQEWSTAAKAAASGSGSAAGGAAATRASAAANAGADRKKARMTDIASAGIGKSCYMCTVWCVGVCVLCEGRHEHGVNRTRADSIIAAPASVLDTAQPHALRACGQRHSNIVYTCVCAGSRRGAFGLPDSKAPCRAATPAGAAATARWCGQRPTLYRRQRTTSTAPLAARTRCRWFAA